VSDTLCSIGLDVGTTTTQLIVSRLKIENKASSFAVPQLTIAAREVVYESPVHFTPLLDASHVDGAGIKEIVAQEYQNAGIRREDIDTGAVIITGETSRKENARAVLDALSEFAGDFVVATAGPDLESILAAKGAGAVSYCEQTGKRLLHMDIGGGTSNLALIEDGVVTATGCLNVGGRLLKMDSSGVICYVSPVLKELCKLKIGDTATPETLQPIARLLAQGLELAAGFCEPSPLLDHLWTTEVITGDGRRFAALCREGQQPVISFSGGVADCIETKQPWLAFGDLGPLLGQAIRESKLCAAAYRLGEHTIRATVIGAGSHSAQLSGSTVFCQNAGLPFKNMPVVCIASSEQTLPGQALSERIRSRLDMLDGSGILALPGLHAPAYSQIAALAEAIADAFRDRPVMVAVEQDMAKALGQAIALRLPQNSPVFCIDSVKLDSGCYLDAGLPVGPALPVVVKTLVLGK